MNSAPTSPTPPRPSVEPRRGIEELRPRVLWVEDGVDLDRLLKILDFPEPQAVSSIHTDDANRRKSSHPKPSGLASARNGSRLRVQAARE